jgi:hypothetical protein
MFYHSVKWLIYVYVTEMTMICPEVYLFTRRIQDSFAQVPGLMLLKCWCLLLNQSSALGRVLEPAQL